jgi:hypothetical protein
MRGFEGIGIGVIALRFYGLAMYVGSRLYHYI